MSQQVRIARPVKDLARSVSMYRSGLGLRESGRFEDHEGFDGVMLELNEGCHLEFTYCNSHPVAPTPTPEDLVVFYLPEVDDWKRRCEAMLEAGFDEVEPFNPYWSRNGRAFVDCDGYIVIIHHGEWRPLME